MCVVGLEPCSVWNEIPRKARKEHRCSSCHKIIAAHENYIDHFSVFEGDVTQEKICLPCSEARAAFDEAHGGEALCTPSHLPYMLNDCISEGDEESELKWKPMLEAIRQRRET